MVIAHMIKLVRFISIGVLVSVALISALLFSAARSDFVFRGCSDFPRSAWAATANCSDGWLGQIIFALATLGASLSAVLVWRMGRPHNA